MTRGNRRDDVACGSSGIPRWLLAVSGSEDTTRHRQENGAGGKSTKPPKPKEQPRDMLYCALKLADPAKSSQAKAQHTALSQVLADRENADRLDDNVPMESVPDPMPYLFDMPSEDSPPAHTQ